MNADNQAGRLNRADPRSPGYNLRTDHPDNETHIATFRPSLYLLWPLMVFALMGSLFIAWMLHVIPQWETWVAGVGRFAFGDASPSPEVWRWIVLGIVFFSMLSPALARMATLLSTQYVVTTQRLHYNRGIVSRYHDQIEVIRIRDLSVIKPLSLRVFGHGHIVLHTEDRAFSMLEMHAISRPEEVKNMLHQLSLGERTRLGYREYEVT